MRNSVRTIAGALLAAVALSIGWLALIRLVDRSEGPPRLWGTPWSGDVAGETRVFFLTSEPRVMHRGGFRSGSTDDRYSRFHLISIDGSTGDTRESLHLGDRRRDEPTPSILALVRDQLWMWDGKIEARDASTLRRLIDVEGIRAANRDLARSIPNDAEFYKSSATFDSMVVKGLDGRHFKVSSDGWKLIPVDAELRAMTSFGVSSAVAYLEPVRTRAVTSGFAIDSTIEDDRWFGWQSDDEKSALTRWRRSGRPVHPSENRSLYRTSCVVREKGKDTGGHRIEEAELDLDAITRIGEVRVFGGFLVDPRTGDAWRLETDDQTSFLLLSKEDLAKASAWRVSRLTSDGGLLWSVDSGIPKLLHVLNGGDTVVFGGDPSNENRGIYEFVMIDTRSGTTQVLNVATGGSVAR